MTLALRERLASIAQRSAYRAPEPRPERPRPRGFEACETPHGIAWRRLDFVSAPTAGPASPDCAYFDTETTGLSGAAGTLIFAAAVARPAHRGLEVAQLFLPEPGAEAAFLYQLAAELRMSCQIATYNGRRFDIPILRNRFVMTGLADDVCDRDHLDLLELARPLLKAKLGSCTLRNVEQRVLSFEREEDLPSYLVPDAYFAYLRRGASEWLEAALGHNRQDAISLFHVHARLLQRLEREEDEFCAVELLSLGRYHLRRGSHSAATRTLRAAAMLGEGEPSVAAALLLATLAVRSGNPTSAERVLAEADARVRSARVAIARARILEWRLRDPAGALGVVRTALDRGPADPEAEHDLRHRQARLERRLLRLAA